LSRDKYRLGESLGCLVMIGCFFCLRFVDFSAGGLEGKASTAVFKCEARCEEKRVDPHDLLSLSPKSADVSHKNLSGSVELFRR